MRQARVPVLFEAVIVGFRTEHQRWTASRLFMPGLRIERQPYEVAVVRNIAHQTSLPTAGPQSTAAWRFFLVILRYQLMKIVFAPSRSHDNAAVGRKIERYRITLGKASLFSNGLGNPDSKAVAPFDISVSCIVYLH